MYSGISFEEIGKDIQEVFWVSVCSNLKLSIAIWAKETD